jgi:hypothetical protein
MLIIQAFCLINITGAVMADKNFEDMTLQELKEFTTELDIDVPKGTKSKEGYLRAIANYYGDGTQDNDIEYDDVSYSLDKRLSKKILKRKKKKEQLLRLTKLVRVLITSNQDNQTVSNTINQVYTVGWGNRLIGYYVDRFILNKPWHIRQGALNNLRMAKYKKPVVNPRTHELTFVEVPAYNIEILTPLSTEEIRKMAEKKKLRDASLQLEEEGV